jgi:tetratricopeptide (TPR) repeat protein
MIQASPRLSWVLVGCALSTIAGCGGASSRYLSYVQRGEQYLAAGNLDKASVEFRNALQIKPRDARARYELGQVEERRGNAREALGSYLAAIEGDPSYTQARVGAGRVLVFAGLAPRALAVVEPGLKQHPDDPQLLTVRGAARAQSKDITGALADAERAVKIAPQDENAVALLASLYQQQGETARAIDLVAGALTHLPDSVDLREVLASLYLAADENPRAEAQLQKIVALAPRDLPRRYQLAGFYVRTGNLDAAQHVLEDAVRVAPDNSGAKLALVDFVASRRSRAQGEQTLRDYIAREPGNDDLRLGLGTLLQRTGTPAEAIAAYQEIITRDPAGKDAVVARDRIAAIQVAGGHVEEASKQLAAALRENPRDNEALTMRGSIALERGDAAAAIEDFRAVLHDRPSAVPLQRALARAYVASGQDALAEETLRNAMQAAPGDTPVSIDLAQLLLRTSRADAATTLLEETVRKAPQDPAAREALGRVYLATRDYAKARTAAEDLKTLAPRAAAGPYLAGLVAQQQGRFDDSQHEFERALQLAPSSMEALSALARVQLAHGQGAAAVARVRSYAVEHATDAAAVNLLGEALIATKSYAQAAEQLNRAIQLAPRWALPYNNLALARLASQDQAGAVDAYLAGLKQLPDEPQLVAGLANLYEQQGQVDRAIALYQELNARNPRLELAANNLAMLLANYRTDERSLDRARDLTAAFAGSSDAALLDTNGWVRLKLGDVADALPALEHAVERAPDSKVIHYHLAIAQLKAGQRDKARANLEMALSGAAHFTGSNDARATLNKLNAGTG